jgi:hypothetical protein
VQRDAKTGFATHAELIPEAQLTSATAPAHTTFCGKHLNQELGKLQPNVTVQPNMSTDNFN